MRILIVHNHYGRFAQGGEANVMNAEAQLLAEHGHEVMKFERTNAEIYETGTLTKKISAFCNLRWSQKSYQEIKKVIRSFRPDIMHVHNYKYVLTPSIFGAAKDLGVSTVLTLHNYRLACPGGQFLRNGSVCEDCLDGFPYRMLWHRCASDNFFKNLAQFYLYWGTRQRKLLTPWVDAYIALSDFGKSKFAVAGLPREQIFVKPNFIDDPLIVNKQKPSTVGAIFVGRLSKEKGVDILIDAWRDIDYPLKIVGDGPLLAKLREKTTPRISFEGSLPHVDSLQQVSQSGFFMLPSVWYEGCPMTLIEAMALGKPVIASDLGPRQEMVKDGYNGFLYPPHDVNALQRKVMELIENPALRDQMGCNARSTYVENYTPEKNYTRLMDIYRYAISRGEQA